MNATVNYYDIETDGGVTKKCFDFSYDTQKNHFSFTPVDDPVTVYKSVIVDSPVVTMRYSIYGLKIIIEGWMKSKNNGYWKNAVTIKIENNDIEL